MSKPKRLVRQAVKTYVKALKEKFPELDAVVDFENMWGFDAWVRLPVIKDDDDGELSMRLHRATAELANQIATETGVTIVTTSYDPELDEGVAPGDLLMGDDLVANDTLVIAGETFYSRLMVGTGKYDSPEACVAALDASGAEIVTVAIRRLDLDNPNKQTELDYIDWTRYKILPNTAGSKTAEEAIFTAKLARELTGSNWLKLEVIPDPRYLLPDPIGTLEAATALVKDGFVVLPYIHADPVLAKRLEEVGCATVMPLGSPIGSGRGIFTLEEIQIIIENAHVPVVVDAGLGAPSEASQALEAGADAVLVNTAIARANDPSLMAEAFRAGVEAGRKAYQAGRIEKKAYATASSPVEGIANAARR